MGLCSRIVTKAGVVADSCPASSAASINCPPLRAASCNSASGPLSSSFAVLVVVVVADAADAAAVATSVACDALVPAAPSVKPH